MIKIEVCRPFTRKKYAKVQAFFHFHMYVRLGVLSNDQNLTHLHIQDGRQNGQNRLRTAYFPVSSPQFLLYGFKFSYASLLEHFQYIYCSVSSGVYFFHFRHMDIEFSYISSTLIDIYIGR